VKALVVQPGAADGGRLVDRPTPAAGPGQVVIAPLLVGICGTDREIAAGAYGEAPPDSSELVLGHEAMARVVTAAPGLVEGQLVVPIVRHPDPVPCANCAVGRWDMCRNGQYTEHGIKRLDGFAAQRAVTTVDHLVTIPDGLGELGILVEPASIVAKAWEQIDRIASRAPFEPRVALITGAGPIGLLAALLARQRGLDTHVIDLVTSGPKPALVAALGAHYRAGPLTEAGVEPDVIVECTGVGSVVLDAIACSSPTGIVCLAGISSGQRAIDLDAAGLNRRMVLENDVVFGTVNASRPHYETAVEALAASDPAWLRQLITRRVPLQRWQDALVPAPEDVKTVIEIDPEASSALTPHR
jgi:threonine dehydrogenase-like Zn-dependent dehydrogenase